MKSFAEYLTESKKTYSFKIGIAGELPENCEDSLETALRRFDLVNMSKGKRTPISERPLDFPNLQNVEVTYFETEMNYPTTAQVLGEYVAQCCGLPQNHIIVRNPNEPQEEYQAPTEESGYETLLTTEYAADENNQKDVGGDRVMELLKELEKARQEREIDPIESVKAGESKDIGDAENSKAVVGG